MIKFLKIFFLWLIFFGFLPIFSRIAAADFETSYKVVYRLAESGTTLSSQASFHISIVNKKSDVYVNKFAISFPKSFTISNLKITDDFGEVTPVIESDDTKNKIEMEFNNPNIGRQSVNNFNLTFEQENLFKVNGNVWEVILPVIENRGDSPYDVTVILPEGSDKKISIAKPVPTSISGREIKWSNPSTRTIYAVFGDSQLYKLNLAYHLKNDNLAPVYMEMAFPPDTLYQKIYLNSLSEKPSRTYQDADGNYMAVYHLKPRQTKTVNADFTVEVFSNPREETIPAIRQLFEIQKKYLLNSQKYWELKSLDKIENLKTSADIYSYVTKTLTYSYERVTKDNVRLGAEKIIQTPHIAVCMEFTDLYVAAAREKGIYSREVEGYGASSDSRLRPLSLSSDVLHAWPEYYDENSGLWKPVDPTWENTSGIDYFNSFDLNHIVFAIHGKRSDYPLPAGMYKVENSKDIEVTAVTSRPEEINEIAVTDISIKTSIADGEEYKGKLSVQNSGNTYIWDIPVEIKASGLNMSDSKAMLTSLAPGEKREINFTYSIPEKGEAKEPVIKVVVSGRELYAVKISIVSPLVGLALKGGVIMLVILGAVLIFKKRRS